MEQAEKKPREEVVAEVIDRLLETNREDKK